MPKSKGVRQKKHRRGQKNKFGRRVLVPAAGTMPIVVIDETTWDGRPHMKFIREEARRTSKQPNL